MLPLRFALGDSLFSSFSASIFLSFVLVLVDGVAPLLTVNSFSASFFTNSCAAGGA